MHYEVTRKIDRSIPKIKADVSGTGARLVDLGDTWRTFIGPVALAVVVGVIGGIFAIRLPAWALALIAGVYVIVFGFVLIRRARIVAAMAAGELFVQRWPLRRNEVVRVRYQRDLKTVLAVREVKAQLICEESATYQQGTDTRTVTEIVFQTPLDLVDENVTPQQIQMDWNVRIPPALPPSLEVYRNRVHWRIKVDVTVDGLPDDDSTFKLLVVPEIVE
jgi:hypothetical protein